MIAVTEQEWPPPVVARAELRALLGVSDARVGQLIASGNFPPPLAELTVGRVWATDKVVAWCETNGRRVYDSPPSGGRKGSHT